MESIVHKQGAATSNTHRECLIGLERTVNGRLSVLEDLVRQMSRDIVRSASKAAAAELETARRSVQAWRKIAMGIGVAFLAVAGLQHLAAPILQAMGVA